VKLRTERRSVIRIALAEDTDHSTTALTLTAKPHPAVTMPFVDIELSRRAKLRSDTLLARNAENATERMPSRELAPLHVNEEMIAIVEVCNAGNTP
jgi:hypothetical protein